MIKDFIDERPMVTLFTRPRRFRKTLNMDMLRTFFKKSHEHTSVYSRDKKIWSCGQKYRDYQGKYPVIFWTFKDVKFDTWTAVSYTHLDVYKRQIPCRASRPKAIYGCICRSIVGHINKYYTL